MGDTNNVIGANIQQLSSNMDYFKQKLIGFGTEYGTSVVGAIIILIIGLMVARWVRNLLKRLLEKQQMEPPVVMLLTRLVWLIVMTFTMVMVLDKFGVPVMTLVAGIGVAGVGVGLAMQGVLSNLVAGLTIIFTKPFRVGEYIQVDNVEGQVKAITLFNTQLLHTDMSKVVVPNRKIVGEIMHNYGTIRQLNLSVGVAYGSNPTEVLALLQEIVSTHPRALKTPAPFLGITELGDCTINFAVRPWTTVADYGPAGGEIYHLIIERFRAQKIDIPFPQREVRLLNGAPQPVVK